MPEDLELSQIGSSQLPPPFRGLHSPGVRKHCQIIFACYFRKSSISAGALAVKANDKGTLESRAPRMRAPVLLMVLGVRLNTEAGWFPAVSALASRCST